MSFERHLRVLHVEFTKTHHNKQVVADLMDQTFTVRRKAILEKSHDIDSLFHQFSFLQESYQVCTHVHLEIHVSCLNLVKLVSFTYS